MKTVRHIAPQVAAQALKSPTQRARFAAGLTVSLLGAGIVATALVTALQRHL